MILHVTATGAAWDAAVADVRAITTPADLSTTRTPGVSIVVNGTIPPDVRDALLALAAARGWTVG